MYSNALYHLRGALRTRRYQDQAAAREGPDQSEELAMRPALGGDEAEGHFTSDTLMPTQLMHDKQPTSMHKSGVQTQK